MTLCRSTCAPPARRAARAALTCVGAALVLAALKLSLMASAEVEAQEARKTRDSVRVTADQMHQIGIIKAELYSFRVLRFAIGQIAYNEDTSTAVLTPFPGRVTRLMAKIGDKVNRGDPLFEIDSPKWCSRRTISSPPSLP